MGNIEEQSEPNFTMLQALRDVKREMDECHKGMCFFVKGRHAGYDSVRRLLLKCDTVTSAIAKATE